MAKFLTTNGITASIDSIIRNAKSELVLLTPFVQLAPLVHERLEEAAMRGVVITLVYGKTEPAALELKKLAAIPGVSVVFLENLHAKCYYNESHMVLTSMNLYRYSAENNREMGLWIDKNVDTTLFAEALQEAQSIMKRATPVDTQPYLLKDSGQTRVGSTRLSVNPPLPRSKKIHQLSAYPKLSESSHTKISDKRFTGHCIRCKSPLPYNPDRPLCSGCYESWSKYENAEYIEKVCHACGRQYEATYERPECKSCYGKV